DTYTNAPAVDENPNAAGGGGQNFNDLKDYLKEASAAEQSQRLASNADMPAADPTDNPNVNAPVVNDASVEPLHPSIITPFKDSDDTQWGFSIAVDMGLNKAIQEAAGGPTSQ